MLFRGIRLLMFVPFLAATINYAVIYGDPELAAKAEALKPKAITRQPYCGKLCVRTAYCPLRKSSGRGAAVLAIPAAYTAVSYAGVYDATDDMAMVRVNGTTGWMTKECLKGTL